VTDEYSNTFSHDYLKSNITIEIQGNIKVQGRYLIAVVIRRIMKKSDSKLQRPQIKRNVGQQQREARLFAPNDGRT